MKYLITFFVSLTIVTQLYSQTKDSGIDKVVNLTYNYRFDEAFKAIDNIRQNGGSAVSCQYLKGMVSYRKAKYYEHFIRRDAEKNKVVLLYDEAYYALSKAAKICDEILNKNPNDTLALFYAGAAYGYIGMYHAKKDELYAAAGEGKKGLDYHDKLIKLCPKWTDVYLSQGIFNYYASKVPWYMKPILWILGRSGDEKKAYEYLKNVADNGHIAKYEAMELLLDYFIEKKQNSSVENMYSRLINTYPGSRYYYGVTLGFYALRNTSFNYYITAFNNTFSKLSSKADDEERHQMGVLFILAANYYMNRKEFSRAIEYWKKLIDLKYLKNEDAWLHTALGDTFAKNNNKKEAISSYRWVIDNASTEKEKQKAREKLSQLN
ncbi:MAG TPA: hypothetical protein VHO03_20120 [Ignavibacteriales bacterium]|nr:hypothetical protein [Ignavibacteriales bacterium]